MDWRDVAQEKLKEVGDAIAQDVQMLLDGALASEQMMVSLADGTTREMNRAEAQTL